MKFDFYMTLPSNASTDYYPDNAPAHFTTRLPHEWRLVGEWAVGLSEIQFPQTFSHIPKEGSKNYVGMWTFKEGSSKSVENKKGADFERVRASIRSGVYRSLDALLDEINNASPVAEHLEFTRDNGGHVNVTQVCVCPDTEHRFTLSRVLCDILGFEYRDDYFLLNSAKTLRSNQPAALSHGLPSVMFVYTDLCESHVTGDVQTPLLRVVPVDLDKYDYGAVRLRSFSNIKYIPLLKSNFDTIEIDIRDEFGQSLLFDRGTLTVTLHFARID